MNRPKLELIQDRPIRLTLLKDKPFIGNNSFGSFYLYHTKDDEGVEYSYFADADIHNLIQEHKLKSGSSFILQRVATMNGKKSGSKVEFSIVGEQETSTSGSDNLKELLLQCINDAADVIKSAGIQFSNDELQKLATTLFIQRSR